MYTVELFYNNSDEHKINKALTVVANNVECNLKAPVDVEKPEITIAATDAYDRVNYARIAKFGRYYYAKAVTKNNQIITYELTSDPLMSFKSGILSSPAVISRNPWVYDKYLPDSKMPIESRTARGLFPFPGTHFSGSNNSYILTTIGGGGNDIPDHWGSSDDGGE